MEWLPESRQTQAIVGYFLVKMHHYRLLEEWNDCLRRDKCKMTDQSKRSKEGGAPLWNLSVRRDELPISSIHVWWNRLEDATRAASLKHHHCSNLWDSANERSPCLHCQRCPYQSPTCKIQHPSPIHILCPWHRSKDHTSKIIFLNWLSSALLQCIEKSIGASEDPEHSQALNSRTTIIKSPHNLSWSEN